MQKPARRQCLAPVKPFAKQPENASLTILRVEIIPRRRRFFLFPPGWGDAFRPFIGDNLMQGAPPAKPQRRTIGRKRHGLDGFGPFEQPQRTRRLLRSRLLLQMRRRKSGGGAVSGRRKGDRAFRQMRRAHLHPLNAAQTKPRAKPVEKIAKLMIIGAAARRRR